MRADVVAHRAGVVLAVLCILPIVALAFWMHQQHLLLPDGLAFLAFLAAGAGLAVYLLSHALGWIAAGFTLP